MAASYFVSAKCVKDFQRLVARTFARRKKGISYKRRCLSPWMVAYVPPDGRVKPGLSLGYATGTCMILAIST
jgi:hypothetical protein